MNTYFATQDLDDCIQKWYLYMYEGCSEIIETLAVNRLWKKLQISFLGGIASQKQSHL